MSSASVASIRTADTGGSAPDRAALLDGLPSLAARIKPGASEREQRRELPFESFRRFRETGLGALRVPQRLGGPGGSVSDLVEVIATIAAADPNVAHALRSHYNFTEQLILGEETPRSRELLGKVLEGAIFAGASTELGTAKPGQVTTRLTRHGDGFRLNGRKFYATGTAFSDYSTFSAVGEDGNFVGVLVPTDRAGITVHDDWDGMGQRLTASGSVDLDDVEVLPHEVTRRELGQAVARHASALRQLHLVTCAAGIVRNVLGDATDYARRNARAALHSAAETGSADAFVQQVVGEVAAASFAIDSIVSGAAAALDRSVAAFERDGPDLDATLIDGALAVARAQLTAYPLALKAAETLFETGGGSTTASRYNFDRHWRNIRTLATHNPLRHKARVVGDYYVNETTTYLKGGRVF